MEFIELVNEGLRSQGLIGIPRKPNKDGRSIVEIREIRSGVLGRRIGCVDKDSIVVWLGGYKRAGSDHYTNREVELSDSEDAVERLKSIGLVLVVETDGNDRLCIACERYIEDYSFDVWSADSVEIWLDGYKAYSERMESGVGDRN